MERPHPLARTEQRRLDGSEPVHADGVPTGATALDFWRWAASDLLSNASRGLLAEFLVRQAIGGSAIDVRREWDRYDIVSPDGVRIEVKSAAYLQRWAQRKLSTISFRTRPTFGWSADEGASDLERRWQADVWVFALLFHTDKATVDPLNVRHWRFYVLPTQVLAARTRSQHSITLPSLEKLCGPGIAFEQLAAAVAVAAAERRQDMQESDEV